MRYRVINQTRNTLLADQAARADSFLSRFKGLMGVPELPMGHGLQIEPCNSIHTFFMRIPIDALFLDQQLQVVDICHALPPWRVSRVYFGARSVLELPAGTAAASQTQPGDRLSFAPVEAAGAPKPS
ncbi:MAG: DUF192 domain-containing protein [Myxococcales bacterium]|nr:DUF192 domain-containing protein [Myxococcales bacterium]